MFLLLSLVLAAPPQFEVTAPTAEERERRAKIRCGGASDEVKTEGEVSTFKCHEQLGVDVTDAIQQSELIVRGKITNIEAATGKAFNDPSHQWKRATVKIASVLRGQAKGTVKFVFINSTKDGDDLYRKVKLGQEGIWILTRGTGVLKELTMMTSLDDHPVSAEAYLKELIGGNACPQMLEGTCEVRGMVCPGASTTCTCEPPCGGGAPPPRDYVPPLRWMCRPTPCASAQDGDKCAPDGMACEGCWGTHPFTCEKGRWKYHFIAPPP